MEPLALTIPADPAALAELRRAMRAWLVELGLVEPDVAAVVAACSEVAADAMESASSRVGETIDVRAELVGSDVVVRSTSTGTWQIDARPSRYVAALLVDHVSIDRSSDATSVVLRKTVSRGLRDPGA